MSRIKDLQVQLNSNYLRYLQSKINLFLKMDRTSLTDFRPYISDLREERDTYISTILILNEKPCCKSI